MLPGKDYTTSLKEYNKSKDNETMITSLTQYQNEKIKGIILEA